MSGHWNPIETAPLREAVVIYHSNRWTRLGCKHEDGSWIQWPTQEILNYKPTHWMEIPDPEVMPIKNNGMIA